MKEGGKEVKSTINIIPRLLLCKGYPDDSCESLYIVKFDSSHDPRSYTIYMLTKNTSVYVCRVYDYICDVYVYDIFTIKNTSPSRQGFGRQLSRVG